MGLTSARVMLESGSGLEGRIKGLHHIAGMESGAEQV